MNEIDRLAEYFLKFPGVGPRQAKRMVYYLLRQNRSWVAELTEAIEQVKARVTRCPACFRHFTPSSAQRDPRCELCQDPNRSDAHLIIVEKDVDLENIEKSHVIAGRYFVLGGLYAPLKKDPEAFIRTRELRAHLAERAAGLSEVILAFAVSPDGDETVQFLRELLSPLAKEHGFRVTTLGRGLSTGSELEYADPATIASALEGRK
jgi:recombination protein RecR